MENKIDINVARLAHLSWEIKLESMVNERKDDASLQSYEDCFLGVWLHSTGVRKYHDYEPVNRLVNVHKEFHEIAENIVASIKKNSTELLKNELSKLRDYSREIIVLLTEIELTSLQQEERKKKLTHPIQGLIKKLFENSINSKKNPDPILQISYSRLTHLKWSQDLFNSFRTWGKSASLEPAELCDLGAWIHAVGLRRYHALEEIQQLDKIHKAFHSKADETLKCLKMRNAITSDSAYEKTLEYSSNIIYLLTKIELKLADSKDIASSVRVFG